MNHDDLRNDPRTIPEMLNRQLEPAFSHALLREMIQEAEDDIRSFDYLATRRRAMLAWLRAVQRGTIKP